ncbi:MAG: carboxypeptidase-like regulatory domain-containing protein [Acidobacteriaceae bacterium]|nr:carboxypeptidase-like regulatory domain-containing protein [Acidobacteriaceae bacterium]
MTKSRKLVRSSVLLLTSVATPLLVTGVALSVTRPALAMQGKEASVRTVEGSVVDKNDKPLANAVVYIKDTRTLAIKSYLTDDQGHFRFGQLSLSTDYDVWAEHNRVLSKTKSISSFNSKPTVHFTFKIDATGN